MPQNFTDCATTLSFDFRHVTELHELPKIGAKYLEVVKRGSHPNNGWSPDEIRNDHSLSLRFVGHVRAWAARHRMTIICLCVPPDTTASGWRKGVRNDPNLSLPPSQLAVS
ncbi:hypothetical protein HKD37_15G043292 [Glycine soja]